MLPPARFPGVAFLLCALLPFAGLRAAETAALSNLSVRTTMAANQTLIVGGVLSGGTKGILVRAAGPALAKFGLNGMSDPRLALYTSGSAPVASNDDWPDSLASVFTSVGAFGFDSGSKDAALTQSVAGAFTAQATGPQPGTVLVEAYDTTGGLSPRMINLSARNRVGTGADVLIAGFSLAGTGTKKLLIRGIGPALGQFGVTGTLADPLLKVFDSRNALVATNDNWDGSLAATAASVGAFSLSTGSKDAALLLTLNAGTNYTAQLSGADGGSGEGLIEVYEVPDPLAEARLPMLSPRPDVGLGFPRIANRLRTTGTVHFKVIFVDFSDKPATRTPQSVFNVLSPGAENFYSALSYGRFTAVLDPSLQWLRMSKPSTGYGWPDLPFDAHRAYIQEALNLAVAAGVDFSTSDSFVVMANPDATALTKGPAFSPTGPSFGVTASGNTFQNGATSGADFLVWGYKWLNHEISHTMSLVDLYAFSGGLTHRFVGDFGIMGNVAGLAPEMFAWERWQLGWLDDAQVVCPDHGTSSVTLTPVETAGGVKVVIVPTGPSSAVLVELRRALGYDTALTRTGPLMYTIDTTVGSGLGAMKVIPLDDTDNHHLGAPMAVGQTQSYANVTVKFLSSDGTNATLQVTRP